MPVRRSKRQEIKSINSVWFARALAGALFFGSAFLAYAPEIESFQKHQNGRVQGFDRIDVNRFKADPQPARFYNEVWFHELQFQDEGIILTLSYQLHNLGLFKGNGGIMTGVSDSNGLVSDRVEFGPDQVKIAEQGFSISMGENLILLEGSTYRVVYKGQKIQADFTCKILVPSFQQGDGTVRFPGTKDFVRYNLPLPLAQAEGVLFVNGKSRKLKGLLCLNHDLQVLLPNRYMSYWRVFWLHSGNATIDVTRCSSASMKGQWVQRLMVADQGKILFSSHDYQFAELALQAISGSKLPCPMRFSVEAIHGADRIRGEIKVTRVQENYNVLESYPSFFRVLAEAIYDETRLYRFWCEFHFELEQNGEKRVLKGTGTGQYVQSVLD